MRAIFGVLGLLVVVAIVGLIARKQLTTAVPIPPMPGAAQSQSGAPVTPKQQVDQFKQGLDATMQAPRVVPDEGK